MIIFGWKRWVGSPPAEPGDFFTWSPRMEQVELFPGLLPGAPDGILDNEGSVSAYEERGESCEQLIR